MKLVYLITSKNPFGYRSWKRARNAQGERRGFAIYFNHEWGWYLKRGGLAYGKAGATKPAPWLGGGSK
jgi:hypothetical protein